PARLSALPAVERRPASLLQVAADYLSLTKPTIVGLLVATALAAMVAAAHGRPPLLAALAVIVGGGLAAGGAHSINCWYDRDIDLAAWSLFLVIFLWTPPHFWALAQVIARDYRQAGVPMMPVVTSASSTKRQSVGYALATVVVSLVPYLTGDAGWVYLVGAIL